MAGYRPAQHPKRRLRPGAVIAIVAIVCVIAIGAVLWVFRPLWQPSSSGQSSSASSSDLSSSSQGSSSGSMASSTVSSKPPATGYLMLVNKTHSTPSDYNPQLATIPNKYFLTDNDHHLEATAATYLEKMIDDAKSDGISLSIVSAYRSKEKQQSLFQNNVNSYLQTGKTQSQAEAETAQTVAPPGYSEHQTGLAADLGYNGRSYLDSSYEKTPAFTWLMTHCADYGFILRYSKDKVDVTKYDYEPWHYRYVGVENAKAIMSSGQCLEEYLGILN